MNHNGPYGGQQPNGGSRPVPLTNTRSPEHIWTQRSASRERSQRTPQQGGVTSPRGRSPRQYDHQQQPPRDQSYRPFAENQLPRERSPRQFGAQYQSRDQSPRQYTAYQAPDQSPRHIPRQQLPQRPPPRAAPAGFSASRNDSIPKITRTDVDGHKRVDSRNNSDSSFDYSADNSGYSTPVTQSRLGSTTNLLPRHGRSPSPNKSARILGIDGSDKPYESLFARNWLEDGSIIKVANHDDEDHMPMWKRRLFTCTPILVILALVSYWAYFVTRIYCVLAAQKKSGEWYPLAWVFIAVELSVAIPTMLHLFMTIFILNPRKRPKYRLIGDEVPRVDVFITCCREDVEVVMDTVRAACDLDYPEDRFRVIVLDDGRDGELEEKCDEARDHHWANLHYRAREKIPGKPHHFKAGNLNYGFDEVTRMPGGAAHFAAALDADMIVERCWLRAIMPHMLIDEKMALACPPQLFYNTPKDDPLSQSLDFFVHVLEGIKDALGVAWCTGSGYILRREALEEIGWFPLGSLAEDVATSTLMLGKGWKTAFIHEPLQIGMVPEDYSSHLKQRTRWAIGTVDTAIKLKFCLWGEGIRRMTFFQRMSGFIYAVLSVFNVFMAISLLAMPIVLISGKPLVAYADEFQLKLLIYLCFANLVTSRLTDLVMSLPSGYSVGQNGARAQLWMSPYIALCLIRSFVLPSWLGGTKQNFTPTGSIQSTLNERDPVLRAGMFTRLRVTLFNYMAYVHVLYVYFCLVAATLTSSKCVFEQYTHEARFRCLLTHALWPPVSWILVVSAFWTPVSYAINPPTVPPRDELLKRDPKTLVAHPKESTKKIAFGRMRNMFELEYAAMTAFTLFIFVSAFLWL